MFPTNLQRGVPEPGARRARPSRISRDQRLATHGVEVVAHGALICPGCRVPVVTEKEIPVQEELECSFCGHADRARQFLVADVYDTAANEAHMVARLRMPVA